MPSRRRQGRESLTYTVERLPYWPSLGSTRPRIFSIRVSSSGLPQTTEARLASARPPSSRDTRPPYRNNTNYDPDSRDRSRDRDRRDRTDRDRTDRDRDRDSHKGRTNGRSKAPVLFLAALHPNSIESSFIQAFIYLSQRISRLGTTFVDKDTVTPPPGSIQCQVLLDTGSLAGDFISGDMLARLEGQDYVYQTPTPLIVKSGLDSSTYSSSDMIDIAIHFLTSKNVPKILRLSVRINPASSVDLIIGFRSFRKHNFFRFFHERFSDDSFDFPTTLPPADIQAPLFPLAPRPACPTKFIPKPMIQLLPLIVGALQRPTLKLIPRSPRTPGTQFAPDTSARTIFVQTYGPKPDDAPVREPRTVHFLTDEVVLSAAAPPPPHDQPPSPHTPLVHPHDLCSPRPPPLPSSSTQLIPDPCTPATSDTSPLTPAPNHRKAKRKLRSSLTSADDTSSLSILAALLDDVSHPEATTTTPLPRGVVLAMDYIDNEKVDTFGTYVDTPPPITSPSLAFLDEISFGGSPELRRQLRALCTEFADIFSDDLPAQPADLVPFEIHVDPTKWECPGNRTAVRPQSALKMTHIQKHIDSMLKSGIIERAETPYYSHPVIVQKTVDTFRFCVDYRGLNLATEQASWPIPNITSLFNRISSHQPDIFGVMDLTSGYHQAPLAPAARKYTAFLCFAGLYQFTRLPFGPKRAPSYFQEQMVSRVLIGLVYTICEIYLGDVLIYGKGNDEFVSRTRQVFTRFRLRRILLKAKKTKLGHGQIEYVGKEILSKGLSMSASKIHK